LAEVVGARRFFCNPKVTKEEILQTAAARVDEAARGRHVLILQDTTEINYQAKAERKRNLGKVGNGEDIGLFAHPALIVDAADGMVLGLAGATIWRRTKVKAKNYQQLPIEKKESFRWLDTAMTARDRLAGAAMATVIGDREADIYELFARVPDGRTHVLIRAEHNRALAGERKRKRKGKKDDGGEAEQVLRLFDVLSAQPEAGRTTFELEGRPGRAKRTVTLAVRYATVALRQPATGANRRDPKSVTLQAIEAREIDAPPGEEAILWRLLTTHPIAWIEDALRLIDLYRLRWLIEQLFRTVKSRGFDIEDSLLAEGQALENLAATTLIAATQVMQLVQGRGEKGEARKASLVFTAAEAVVIKAVVKKFEGQTLKQKNLYRPGTLAWAAWAIARLGGWKGYATERPPGPITFANGLKRFHAICEGYDLATLRSS
jgi:D-alanyl-D-alanine dipeptidase